MRMPIPSIFPNDRNRFYQFSAISKIAIIIGGYQRFPADNAFVYRVGLRHHAAAPPGTRLTLSRYPR